MILKRQKGYKKIPDGYFKDTQLNDIFRCLNIEVVFIIRTYVAGESVI